MTVQEKVVVTMMAPEQKTLEEGAMVHKERWEEVRRRYFQERKAIAEIARGLDMDRKTVRRCVHEEQWHRISVYAAGRRCSVRMRSTCASAPRRSGIRRRSCTRSCEHGVIAAATRR
jgi:hypothetical protein